MEVSAPNADPMTADCPGRDLFLLATGKWTLLILWSLKSGPRRFHQLRDDVEGISERVLSATLKSLCRNGLTMRHVEASIPPKVSYELTPTGKGLLSVMEGLTGWIAAEIHTVEDAKARYDRENEV
ncbi:helix-turn-helix transcriptional regulator [Paracoccus aurantiacus]|uniref:Helix-turn-helix transcriptional regulator n=1 Tax=Paracoccus aurantiacus TaxID=2599412 RepID=A0A5C6S550_9RHOB|nr:helix-turn-helix domain-containing protein [Paracoccus aurantiacus]TXB69626.1 helix-turn-helix transcriptional regulator [Paracoccus aurantiacus]